MGFSLYSKGMVLFNAHLHLSASRPPDLPGIYNATDESQWQQIIALYHAKNHIFPAIGIHPWFVQSASAHWEADMAHLLATHSFLQIGEIGLDALKPGIEQQEDLFIRQLQLAKKYHRIASIHAVRTLDRIRGIMEKISFCTPFILHDYHATKVLTHSFCELNAYFSIGRHFAPSHLDDIPLNRLLIETDAQDPTVLSPLADKIAVTLGMTKQAFARQINVNVKELFHDN